MVTDIKLKRHFDCHCCNFNSTTYSSCQHFKHKISSTIFFYFFHTHLRIKYLSQSIDLGVGDEEKTVPIKRRITCDNGITELITRWRRLRGPPDIAELTLLDNAVLFFSSVFLIVVVSFVLIINVASLHRHTYVCDCDCRCLVCMKF